MRILTIRAFCCTFFTIIALLLLRDIILSFHGKGRLLLLLRVNLIWHSRFFLAIYSTIFGLELRCSIVWTLFFILTVASLHAEVDIHHLLIVLFLRFFDCSWFGAHLLVQYSTNGTISAVCASSMGLLFSYYNSMCRRRQRSWITAASKWLSL